MSANTNPTVLQGAWHLGWSLDFHTTSSEFLGYDDTGNPRFETHRSELGELVFQLKYRNQRRAATDIASAIADFLNPKAQLLPQISAVVAVPPSSPRRSIQPVAMIAEKVGKRISKPFLFGAVLKSRDTPQLKAVDDPAERRDVLEIAFEVSVEKVSGQGILLVDDLYRSGATANAVTLALYRAGASRVYFIAVTRTRSRQ